MLYHANVSLSLKLFILYATFSDSFVHFFFHVHIFQYHVSLNSFFKSSFRKIKFEIIVSWIRSIKNSENILQRHWFIMFVFPFRKSYNLAAFPWNPKHFRYSCCCCCCLSASRVRDYEIANRFSCLWKSQYGESIRWVPFFIRYSCKTWYGN